MEWTALAELPWQSTERNQRLGEVGLLEWIYDVNPPNLQQTASWKAQRSLLSLVDLVTGLEARRDSEGRFWGQQARVHYKGMTGECGQTHEVWNTVQITFPLKTFKIYGK